MKTGMLIVLLTNIFFGTLLTMQIAFAKETDPQSIMSSIPMTPVSPDFSLSCSRSSVQADGIGVLCPDAHAVTYENAHTDDERSLHALTQEESRASELSPAGADEKVSDSVYEPVITEVDNAIAQIISTVVLTT